MNPTTANSKIQLSQRTDIKSIELSTREDRCREKTFDVWQNTDKQGRRERRNNEVRKLKRRRERKMER